MAKSNSTAGNKTTGKAAPSPASTELSQALAVLKRIMGAGDEKIRKMIFSQVICQMAEDLPEVSSDTLATKGNTVPHRHHSLNDAIDKLFEASRLGEFLQMFSLNGSHDGVVEFQPRQLAGFYVASSDLINRIDEATALIEAFKAQPEATPT